MRQSLSLYALNRGVVSRYGLARVDVKRAALAAEEQTNWIPRVLGSMMLRPGFGYLGTLSNESVLAPFVFSTSDTALLELSNLALRIWISDSLLTRPAVTAAVLNSGFDSNLNNWTDNDEAGATSSWETGGYMKLVGNGTARAIRDQTVTPIEANVEHALRVIVQRGPVTFQVGSTSGGDQYVSSTTLNTGTHSLAFTPTGDFYIRFSSNLVREVLVNSCTIESAGVVSITTPWPTASLQSIRYDQSADVVFMSCDGYKPRRVERRGTGRSWSVADYEALDGPFFVQNTGVTTLTPSAISGNITVTASLPTFRSTHVGSLWSITSVGQQVSTTASSSGVPTDSIRVTGIDNDRIFSVIVSGNASASTVDLQRSYDNSTWANVGGAGVYTADTTTAIDDSLDNQIVYYRLYLTTRVAPDSVTMQLRIGSGSVRGIVRLTGYTSSTSVSAEVIETLGGTTASDTWQEGQWSDYRGWPTAVQLHEGRLWWSGQNGIWGSISDAYDSFDETFPGNAGCINRTIGSGPVDTVNFLLSLKGLILGAQGAEYTARASSLDEPLTPTNFNIKTSSTQGSGGVPGVKIDQSGYFVNRSGVKAMELSFAVAEYDYKAINLMELAPEIGSSGITRIAVQRLPDTRLHCVLADGTVAVCVMNKAEEVAAWIKVETDGVVEEVCVLPALSGYLDDQVYYIVKRTINGSDVRYLEKWAQEDQCRGDQQLCYLADSYVTYSGASTTTITGLSHLEGEDVVVWSGGDIGTDESTSPWTQLYTVSGGSITLASAVTSCVVGLGYQARFKSAKFGPITQEGSPLNRQKKMGHIGFIAADIHPKGIKYGPTFDALDDMPQIEQGKSVGSSVVTDYDENLIEFPGTWSTDARVCIQAQAPRPATVIAVTVEMVSN